MMIVSPALHTAAASARACIGFALTLGMLALAGCTASGSSAEQHAATRSGAPVGASSPTAAASGMQPSAASKVGSAAATSGTSTDASSTAGAAAPAMTAGKSPPPAAGCEPNALDQQGCACAKPGATRPCYSADPATRNVGECKDGIQTCIGGTTAADQEFGMQYWGPCMEQVVPTECTEQLDARCVGKVGCADEQCADKLGCTKDAGVPDAGNRHCITVRGFGIGTGFFADGGMWCER